jgi:aminopeptidase N
MTELLLGLNDKYDGLRRQTINLLAKSKLGKDEKVLSSIEVMAGSEKDKKTKAAALRFLAATKDAKYQSIFNKSVGDSSYSVAGAALEGLSTLEPTKSYELAKKYSLDAKGALGEIVGSILVANGTEADFDFIAGRYNEAPPSQEKLELTDAFCDYLLKVNEVNKVKKGIDYIIKFRSFIPEQYKGFTDPSFKAGLGKLAKAKPGEVAEYIERVFK